jgi:FKBP-type peptidyl-prolyl cis-trans isomerase
MRYNIVQTNAFVFIIAIFLIGCNGSDNRNRGISKKELDKILIDANKLQVAYDTQRVVSFIRLNNWNMQQTKTGLWYEILDTDNGPLIQNGDLVALTYRVNLLDGSLCYSSEKSGPKIFKVSRGGVESGLEEGILLLKGGDSARFIMPQYRAHHLLGDGDKIPPLSTIVYHLRVVEVASMKTE